MIASLLAPPAPRPEQAAKKETRGRKKSLTDKAVADRRERRQQARMAVLEGYMAWCRAQPGEWASEDFATGVGLPFDTALAALTQMRQKGMIARRKTPDTHRLCQWSVPK